MKKARQTELFPAPKQPRDTTGKMPAWLVRALETKTGGFRGAHFNKCPDCHQWILEGLDEDTCAFTVQADPTPLTPKQEAACATIGRPTYCVEFGPRLELTRRDSYSKGRPSEYPIIPAHKCGARFKTYLTGPGAKSPTHGANDNDCPF